MVPLSIQLTLILSMPRQVPGLAKKWSQIFKRSNLMISDGTMVEHMPSDQEFVGSSPVWCWSFFSFLSREFVKQVQLLKMDA